jgi:hypothetical protein
VAAVAKKLPALMLYPNDWIADDVAGCSIAAQGLWLRLMFIMHGSDRYGYLSKNSVPIPPDALAQRCGCSLEQYTTLLAELVRANIPSANDKGIIYSRRMVRDAARRAQAAERQGRHRKSVTDALQTPPLLEDENEIEIISFTLDWKEKDCCFGEIPSRVREMWQATYPNVDIDAEMRRMVMWIVSDEKHRKRNYLKFVTNWLSRTQERLEADAAKRGEVLPKRAAKTPEQNAEAERFEREVDEARRERGLIK